jgi:hypothetical protein
MSTKVIFSFSMAGMGLPFCSWLRDQINKERGYGSVDSVYIDNIAMRELASTTLTPDNRFNTPPSPNTLIGAIHQANPDLRQVAVNALQRDPFIAYTGAKNPDWKKFFLQAMSEAHTMVFCLTEAWFDSRWCLEEWSQFVRESKGRPSNHLLKGVALAFPDSYKTSHGLADTTTAEGLKSAMSANADNVAVLALTKVPGIQAPDSSELVKAGAWGISASDLRRVLAEIAPDGYLD